MTENAAKTVSSVPENQTETTNFGGKSKYRDEGRHIFVPFPLQHDPKNVRFEGSKPVVIKAQTVLPILPKVNLRRIDSRLAWVDLEVSKTAQKMLRDENLKLLHCKFCSEPQTDRRTYLNVHLKWECKAAGKYGSIFDDFDVQKFTEFGLDVSLTGFRFQRTVRELAQKRKEEAKAHAVRTKYGLRVRRTQPPEEDEFDFQTVLKCYFGVLRAERLKHPFIIDGKLFTPPSWRAMFNDERLRKRRDRERRQREQIQQIRNRKRVQALKDQENAAKRLQASLEAKKSYVLGKYRVTFGGTGISPFRNQSALDKSNSKLYSKPENCQVPRPAVKLPPCQEGRIVNLNSQAPMKTNHRPITPTPVLTGSRVLRMIPPRPNSGRIPLLGWDPPWYRKRDGPRKVVMPRLPVPAKEKPSINNRYNPYSDEVYRNKVVRKPVNQSSGGYLVRTQPVEKLFSLRDTPVWSSQRGNHNSQFDRSLEKSGATATCVIKTSSDLQKQLEEAIGLRNHDGPLVIPMDSELNQNEHVANESPPDFSADDMVRRTVSQVVSTASDTSKRHGRFNESNEEYRRKMVDRNILEYLCAFYRKAMRTYTGVYLQWQIDPRLDKLWKNVAEAMGRPGSWAKIKQRARFELFPKVFFEVNQDYLKEADRDFLRDAVLDVEALPDLHDEEGKRLSKWESTQEIRVTVPRNRDFPSVVQPQKRYEVQKRYRSDATRKRDREVQIEDTGISAEIVMSGIQADEDTETQSNASTTSDHNEERTEEDQPSSSREPSVEHLPVVPITDEVEAQPSEPESDDNDEAYRCCSCKTVLHSPEVLILHMKQVHKIKWKRGICGCCSAGLDTHCSEEEKRDDEARSPNHNGESDTQFDDERRVGKIGFAKTYRRRCIVCKFMTTWNMCSFPWPSDPESSARFCDAMNVPQSEINTTQRALKGEMPRICSRHFVTRQITGRGKELMEKAVPCRMPRAKSKQFGNCWSPSSSLQSLKEEIEESETAPEMSEFEPPPLARSLGMAPAITTKVPAGIKKLGNHDMTC